MTAIAVWHANVKGEDCVFAASDSRITGIGTGSIFTDEAAKLLPLRLKYLESDGEPFRDSGRSREYGLAYAGHTEVASLTYFALANVTAHVGLLPGMGEPALAHVADLLRRILQRYTDHYVGAGFKDENFPRCQMAIFGWCPSSRRPEIHLVESSRFRAARSLLHEKPEPLWLGDGGTLLQNAWTNTPQTGRFDFRPLAALERIAEKELKRSVGGGTQFAQVDCEGYHVFATQLGSEVLGTAEYLGMRPADELDPAFQGFATVPIEWIITR